MNKIVKIYVEVTDSCFSYAYEEARDLQKDLEDIGFTLISKEDFPEKHAVGLTMERED